jgi:thiamine-phosphate pyrophosphorylase
MVIITRRMCYSSWRTLLEDLLAVGARAFQLREKRLSTRDFCAYAAQFVERARRKDALTIINDRADVALAANADGVHLGQDDLPIDSARRMLGKGALIGLSCHDYAEAKAAVAAGADYVGLGAMFDTRTKVVTKMAGPALLSEVASRITVPVLAIGGIKASNVGELGKAGAKHAAVCSAIIRSRTPGKAYRDIVDALKTGTKIEEPESLPTTEVSP